VTLYALGPHTVTTVGDDFFVAPNAAVIGRVSLGRDANVWFSAVLRGDTNVITIGHRTNVQDTAVVHVDHDAPAFIGDEVTIGHGATVHACRVGDRSLIGIGATILSHAVIGRYCIVGAGALVPPGKVVPAGWLVMGVPATPVRQMSPEEIEDILRNAREYVALWRRDYGEK